MTRVAGANPRIWVDIFLDNADALARRARRAPPPRSSRSRRRSRRGDAGFLARWIGEAAGNRRRMLEQRVRRTPARCSACASTSPTGRACSPGSRRRSAPSGSTSRTSSSQHISPERGGTLDAARHRRGRGARAPPSCSRRRATASSSRRCSRTDGGRAGRAGSTAHVARPGDKSISHRALLLGAICRRARRVVRGFGPLRRHRVDARRRARARRARSTRRTSTRSSSTAPACAGSARPTGRSTAATPARSIGSLAGHPRRPGGPLRARRRRVALARGRWSAIAEPLRLMGAAIETTDGRLPLVDRRAARSQAIDYELPVASAQVKSAILLAGLGARRARRRCVEPAPTRDHTELMLAAAGARVTRRPRLGHASRPAERLAPARGRRPGRHLLGRAVPRRGRAAARLGADRPRRRPQPAPHRASSTCSSGWARGSRVYNRRTRRAASRSATSRSRAAELVATEIEPDEVPLLVDELPLFALARRAARAATSGVTRRRGAAREGDRPDRGGRRRAARDRRAASRRTHDGFAVTRRPDPPARRRDRRRAATTGSRCSARVAGARLARGRRDRGRRVRRDKLPRLLRRARLADVGDADR